MGKRIDGLKPTGTQKKPKGKSKQMQSYTNETLRVSAGQLNELGGTVDSQGLFRLMPVNDDNKYLLQANYYIANKNQFKARQILKGLGMTSKQIKHYIDGEVSLQNRKPESSGFNDYFNQPMPEEYIVRTN